MSIHQSARNRGILVAFLNGENKQNIAVRSGISRERVRQIVENYCRHLRKINDALPKTRGSAMPAGDRAAYLAVLEQSNDPL